MANIKSAKKRVRIGERNLKINRLYKSSIKNLIKKYRIALKSIELNKNSDAYPLLQSLVSQIYSRIDKAAKKNVFHPRKAARKKSRINKLLKKVAQP